MTKVTPLHFVRQSNREVTPQEQTLQRIQALAKVLKNLTIFMLTMTLVVFSYLWFTEQYDTLLDLPADQTLKNQNIHWLEYLAILFLALLRPLAFMPVFLFLYRLSIVYSKGLVFTKINSIYIRRIGFSIIFIDIINIFQSALAGPVLTLLSLVEPYFVLSLNFSFFIIGFFIVLIGRIMLMACEIKTEHDYTV